MAVVVGTILFVATFFALYHYRVAFPGLSLEDSSLIRVAQAEEAAFKTYRKEKNAEGTQALLSLTQLLQKEEARWQSTGNGRIFAADLGLTYGRLALLAESLGATNEQNENNDQARLWLTKSGHVITNEQEIRAFVLRADESGDQGAALDSDRRTNTPP